MAYFVTHSPEQLQKWEQIVVSNPARVVRAIAVSVNRRTREGDTTADIYPALAAIAEAARRETNPNGYDGTEWDSLVEAGVVDQLCKVIDTLTPFNLHAGRDNTPQHVMEAMAKEIQTPYQLPIEILCNAMINTKDLASPLARKVTSTVKKHWLTISQRVWDDPINSLLPSDVHVLARVVYTQLCLVMITTEPSILNTVYGMNDPTIPIIARYWKHSTKGDLDIKFTTQFLWWILEPQHPKHVKYVREHGSPASELLLSRIYSGVGPKPTSSAPTQASALMGTLAKHVSQSTEVPLNFLLQLSLEFTRIKDPVLVAATRKSGAFWSACIAVIRKMPEEPQPVDVVSAMHALGLIANVTHHTQLDAPTELEPLVKLLVDQGLFDALDKQIAKLVAIRGVHMQITRIVICVHNALQAGPSALKKRLSGQFPRWKTAGTLIYFDVRNQGDTNQDRRWANDQVPGPNSLIWVQASWQSFVTLQNSCFDWSLCGRRTCGKPGEIKCGCEEVSYCSESCQKKDADVHEIAHRFMQFVRHGDNLVGLESSEVEGEGEQQLQPVSEGTQANIAGLS